MRYDELLEEPLSGQAVNFRGPFQNGRSIAVRAVRRGDRSKGRLSGNAGVLTIRQVSIGRIHREDENPQPQQVLTKIGGLSIEYVVLSAVTRRGAKRDCTFTGANTLKNPGPDVLWSCGKERARVNYVTK